MYQNARIVQRVKINLYEELYKNFSEKTIGNRIEKSRLIKNLSQYELSKLVGVNHSTIQDYESGMCYPSPNILTKIASALNRSLQYFYDDYYKFIFSEYGSMIKSWRAKNNLTYWKAGKLTGIDYKSFKNWENGMLVGRIYFEKLKPYLKE